MLINKAASEAFCSKIALSSDTGASSTSLDETTVSSFVSVADSFRVADWSVEPCSLNDSDSDVTAGALTKTDAVVASFPSSSA